MKREPDKVAPVAVASAAFVRFGPVTEAMTGITAKAQHQKVNAGVWTEGEEWIKGPDGRRYLDVEGYNAWIRRQPRDARGRLPAIAISVDNIAEAVAELRAKVGAGADGAFVDAQFESLLVWLRDFSRGIRKQCSM